MLDNPKKNTEFRLYQSRLALFHKAKGHLDYWQQYWEDSSVLSNNLNSGSAWLYEFNDLFERFIPPVSDGLVLEAGCGAGLFVNAFYNRGNKVIGIDYEPKVIEALQQKFPDIDYRQGNILSLDIKDRAVSHYISLGVLEHFEDPAHQSKALQEAYRILKNDGMAYISVPYLNNIRSRHMAQLQESGNKQDYTFHQYYYSIEDFRMVLQAHGFDVVETFGYSCQSFLTREVKWLKWLLPKLPWRVKNIFNQYFLKTKSKKIRSRYAHMMMYVCRKHL